MTSQHTPRRRPDAGPQMITTEPTGYDGEGYPLYAEDDLDRNYRGLLDNLKADTALTVDRGVWELLDVDNSASWDDFLWALDDLIDRERQRRSKCLPVEDGRRVWHDETVARLRDKADKYAAMRDRAGWPQDPADLDDDQLEQARLVLLHPRALECFLPNPVAEKEQELSERVERIEAGVSTIVDTIRAGS